MLERSLNKLNSKYKEPLVLYYFEDMDYREIADILTYSDFDRRRAVTAGKGNAKKDRKRMNMKIRKQARTLSNSIKERPREDAPAQLFRVKRAYHYRRDTAFLPHHFYGHIHDLCITAERRPFRDQLWARRMGNIPRIITLELVFAFSRAATHSMASASSLPIVYHQPFLYILLILIVVIPLLHSALSASAIPWRNIRLCGEKSDTGDIGRL